MFAVPRTRRQVGEQTGFPVKLPFQMVGCARAGAEGKERNAISPLNIKGGVAGGRVPRAIPPCSRGALLWFHLNISWGAFLSPLF